MFLILPYRDIDITSLLDFISLLQLLACRIIWLVFEDIQLLLSPYLLGKSCWKRWLVTEGFSHSCSFVLLKSRLTWPKSLHEFPWECINYSHEVPWESVTTNDKQYICSQCFKRNLKEHKLKEYNSGSMWASYRFTCHNNIIWGKRALGRMCHLMTALPLSYNRFTCLCPRKRAFGRLYHLMGSEVARRIQKE